MDLKRTLFIVPNLLTAASLFCGTAAVMRCVNPSATGDDVYNSALLIFYAFLFDLFDGRVARLTRTQSSFGIEFDSLADLISFGVAPAVITYRWALSESSVIGIAVCFIYVLGGAVRLARFNILSGVKPGHGRQPPKYMLGLPIPMAAAFIVSLVVAARAMGGWPWLTSHRLAIKGISYPMIALVMLALAFLMMSSIKFRSFKDVKLNAFSLSLLVLTLVSTVVLWATSKPAYILIWLLCVYVAIGFGEAIISWPKNRKRRVSNDE